MEIIVYGKLDCGKCEAAKQKIEKMGFEYDYKILTDYIEPHDSWREDNSVEIMAAHTMIDDLPIIKINNNYFTYPRAMKLLKLLKERKKNGST